MPSPFAEAAVLAVDGIGEYDTTYWLGLGIGDDLQMIKTLAYPHSLGFVGNGVGSAGILTPRRDQGHGTGGLTGLQRYAQRLASIIRLGTRTFVVDHDALRFRCRGPLGGAGCCPKPKSRRCRHAGKRRLAAALQAQTETVLIHLRAFKRTTNQDRLCLAGGGGT